MILGDAHKARLITAGVGLAALVAALLAGGWLFFALAVAVCLAGLWEFYALFGDVPGPVRLLGLGLGALMLFLAWTRGPLAGAAALLAGFWLEEALRLAWAAPAGRAWPRWLMCAGLLYVPACLMFAVTLPEGAVVLILAAVMATDTGAYYAGHLLGGPKIWPRVSPKKTWAGSLGGLACACLVCLAFGAWRGGPPLAAWLALGVWLSVCSQLGDFIESGLKRACDVKDSGTLLPGHGGILDRIDGLLPAILAYALARTWANFP